MSVAAVVIGRNEGARLLACLNSLPASVSSVVYVDSGSSDGSVDAASARGARIVELDPDRPFTAARARNAGLDLLRRDPIPPAFVQFIDGDCTLRKGWIETATAFLKAHDDAAVACGRRRERFPEASVYNALADAEWDTPVGRTRSCGGDAMMRWQALEMVDGYDPLLIAGEEPELCVRLRKAGWSVWRLDAEMTWHDAAMTRFSQWWRRCKRAGHAFAEGAALHGAPPERHNVAQTRRALIWGGALPVLLVAGLVLTPWAGMLALLWVAKFFRLKRQGLQMRRAFFLTLGNLPEALGVLSYWISRLLGRRRNLIEYK